MFPAGRPRPCRPPWEGRPPRTPWLPWGPWASRPGGEWLTLGVRGGVGSEGHTGCPQATSGCFAGSCWTERQRRPPWPPRPSGEWKPSPLACPGPTPRARPAGASADADGGGGHGCEGTGSLSQWGEQRGWGLREGLLLPARGSQEKAQGSVCGSGQGQRDRVDMAPGPVSASQSQLSGQMSLSLLALRALWLQVEGVVSRPGAAVCPGHMATKSLLLADTIQKGSLAHSCPSPGWGLQGQAAEPAVWGAQGYWGHSGILNIAPESWGGSARSPALPATHGWSMGRGLCRLTQGPAGAGDPGDSGAAPHSRRHSGRVCVWTR